MINDSKYRKQLMVDICNLIDNNPCKEAVPLLSLYLTYYKGVQNES